MGYIIGIDFDGTVVTHEYPDVGRDIGAVPVLKRLVNSGNKLILFTMRSSRNGTLQDAVNWFKDNGIELYGVNTNPTQSEWTDSTKAHCNIYIDDAGLATPTKYDEESGREYVDWKRVEQILDRKFGAFEEEEKDFDDEEFYEIFKQMLGKDEKNKKIDEQYKMQKNVVKINEAQLRGLIKESVKKALMNEISSDMISRASKKFHQKYGGTLFPGPDAKDFPKDKNGNLLYPKDKRTLAQHYRNFNDAYKRAKEDEDLSNPLLKKAQELYDQVDLEQEVSDWTDDYGCDVNLYGEIEDENGGLWKFEGWGAGVNVGGGDIEIDHVEEMNFESPDGQTGSVPKP